ncbi:hypothetical protein HYE68_005832 [Fusarium pseudograminearum]|uniref:Apple domain-containing protein n=1 Tax=Fusarium pseudograminearum (strain CS3096) TaxID=1028729 RepID=K3W135_FUSPC|nr:hypothetical protein FPSE_04601 [Fusarium pseudograminearum CS3096]EKJ75210.1 hypothetical protein FPSE_04601 [Fusarium pseudograminearum CS3096]KAF0645629.1 hypothetical protein FPSE5266_04601 [Fusarium pseudograminearum]QPC75080.1 hypothetical protein HYE68_005832 [Fusarium pseudograminearum]
MYFSNILVTLASMATMASAIPAPDSLLDTTSSISPADFTINLDKSGSALEARTSFSCPGAMSYCPWTKACSCPVGQSWDARSKRCAGTKTTGCYAKPKANAYVSAGVDVKLDTYCAASPYKIVKYDTRHSYCQASLKNTVFLAPLAVGAEIALYGGAAIDVKAKASVSLRAVCSGLAGLYLESSVDAVALFNTNKYGYSVRPGSVTGGLSFAITDSIKSLTCRLGLGNCAVYDCVSYCSKGCKNYIDVRGNVGGYVNGLAGFCVVKDSVLFVNKVGACATLKIEGLLRIVGSIHASIKGLFKCNC